MVESSSSDSLILRNSTILLILSQYCGWCRFPIGKEDHFTYHISYTIYIYTNTTQTHRDTHTHKHTHTYTTRTNTHTQTHTLHTHVHTDTDTHTQAHTHYRSVVTPQLYKFF